MTLLKGWKLKLFAGLALASAGGHLHAQMKPGSVDPRVLGQGPQVGPASYQIPGPPPGMPGEGYMDPSRGTGMDPNMPQVPCGPDGSPLGPEGCGPEGYGGYDPSCDRYGRSVLGLCDNLQGRLAGCRGKLRPYGEGGIATQRWFDISAEAIFLARTKGAANFNTTSLGAGSNNFLLGTNAVDLNNLEAGLSLQANLQVSAGSNLEVVYFGLNNWEQSAAVERSTPSLFSFLSNFGTVPANGFDDPDRSLRHALSYKSELHNGEINIRRRWSEPNGFFQGSFLGGVRYIDLDERASFTARGEFNNTFANNSLRFLDYTTNTQNSLVGFQLGGDLWYNMIPGVKIGVEAKSGLFNNRAHQITSVFANSLPDTISEEVLSNRIAYVTQIAPQLVYRLNHSWAVRSSYQFIYIDGVALATENFNPTPPAVFLPNSARSATINNDAEIILQGFTVGAEYTW